MLVGRRLAAFFFCTLYVRYMTHSFFIAAHRAHCEQMAADGVSTYDYQFITSLDHFIDEYLIEHHREDLMWFFHTYVYDGSDTCGGEEFDDDGYLRHFWGDRAYDDELHYSPPLLHGPPHLSQLDRIQRPYEHRYESVVML